MSYVCVLGVNRKLLSFSTYLATFAQMSGFEQSFRNIPRFSLLFTGYALLFADYQAVQWSRLFYILIIRFRGRFLGTTEKTSDRVKCAD